MTDTTCIAKNCGHGKPRLALANLLCYACLARLERNLAETPALTDLIRLEFLETGSGAGNDGSKRTKGQPPLPLNLHALNELTRLSDVLLEHLKMVCDYRDLHGPAHPSDAAVSSAWLLGHLPWITAQPWVGDFDVELREAVHSLRVVIGEATPQTPFGFACPLCGEKSLKRLCDDNGDTTEVRCCSGGCHDDYGRPTRWGREELGLLAQMLEAQGMAS